MQENIKWFNDRGYGVKLKFTLYNKRYVIGLYIHTMKGSGEWDITTQADLKNFINNFEELIDGLFDRMRSEREWQDARF